MAEDLPKVAWAPQSGPQEAFVNCPAFDVLYGGARGGGKTDAMLGDWALHANRFGQHARGLFVRREIPQLDAAIARSKAIYYPLGAEWGEQAKRWTFPNGAMLNFRPLEREDDAEKYQGHEYTRIYAEELTNWASSGGVDRLKATLRSSAGVPVGFRASANPGGVGHLWVKQRYVDPAPFGMELLTGEGGQARVFIPAKLSDNRILTDADPGYADRLKTAGSASLVRAWLNGDWDIVEGAFFDTWSASKHVVRPFEIPKTWPRFRSMDWGSARPFSVGWWAVAMDAKDNIPRGCLVRYREWYGAKSANVGLKMTADDVALGIKQREVGDTVTHGVCDPAMSKEDGGPSIMQRMALKGVHWRPADNSRVAGWDQVRARLNGEDGKPMVVTFSTCVDSVRTLPALQHDRSRPEDVDTDGEDHAGDEWRYACMSRPYKPPVERKDARGPNDRYRRTQQPADSWRVA
jgi:hypothetical protein